MKKEYHLLNEMEKFKYWEGVISHKIRAQAEAGGDPDSAITEEFIEYCKKRDNNFVRFIPALSITFPVMNNFISGAGKKKKVDRLKMGVLIFSAILFFGIQILLIIKEGYNGLIFAWIVNSIMGIVFYIGLRINSRIKDIYRHFAEITGLNFKYSTGGLPGFLYDPCLDGFYNGFQVTIRFENKWTGRWSHGQNGLGQAQTISRSTLIIKLPSSISPDVLRDIIRSPETNNMKGDISFTDDSINYEVIGAINSEKMKDDLINALDILTEKLFKIV